MVLHRGSRQALIAGCEIANSIADRWQLAGCAENGAVAEPLHTRRRLTWRIHGGAIAEGIGRGWHHTWCIDDYRSIRNDSSCERHNVVRDCPGMLSTAPFRNG